MPVYIRKNVNFTPPSIDNFPMEDDEDYITDPDQLLDRLPQPYRMIDKVLTQWYDDVWEIIEKRENARLEESRKIRPPQYECSTQMKVQSFYRYRIFAGIEYLFTLHGINEKISRFKRTYYACLLHV